MNIGQKLLRLFQGKANSAIEAALDPMDQLLLLKEEFINQVGIVAETRTKVVGELKFAKKELAEMNTELLDFSATLDKMKEHVKAGNTLTDDDKARGQKLIAKRDRLTLRITNQEAEVQKIDLVAKQLDQKTAELEAEKEKVNDKIEDAQRTKTTSVAVESYAKALEIINDNTTSKSLETQIHKLEKEASTSEARAEIANKNSDSFDFKKNDNAFDDFMST